MDERVEEIRQARARLQLAGKGHIPYTAANGDYLLAKLDEARARIETMESAGDKLAEMYEHEKSEVERLKARVTELETKPKTRKVERQPFTFDDSP